MAFELPAPIQSGSIVNNVSLKIFDILGREVATLVSGNQDPGRHEIEWNASNYTSGIYFYQIRVDVLSAGSFGQGFTETKKMILLR